jgi:hypothetical protein
MSELKYDIIAKVRFFTEEEGGRKSPTLENFFGCPMVIREKKYDCRLLLSNIGPISPGDEVVVPIKFLDYKTVSAILKENDNFELWEMGIIAEGKVLESA